MVVIGIAHHHKSARRVHPPGVFVLGAGGPRGGGMSWEDAHAQVADEFSAAGTRLTSDGVKKRRLKVEKLLKSGILTRRVKRA